jgi:hypothetical protein
MLYFPRYPIPASHWTLFGHFSSNTKNCLNAAVQILCRTRFSSPKRLMLQASTFRECVRKSLHESLRGYFCKTLHQYLLLRLSLFITEFNDECNESTNISSAPYSWSASSVWVNRGGRCSCNARDLFWTPLSKRGERPSKVASTAPASTTSPQSMFLAPCSKRTPNLMEALISDDAIYHLEKSTLKSRSRVVSFQIRIDRSVSSTFTI